MICLDRDIKYRLNATAHLPLDSLREPLEVIEACWGDPTNTKLAANSLLGLWVRKRISYNITTSRCELDAPEGDSLKRLCFYRNTQVDDWVPEVDGLSPQTKFPLWLLVMNSESWPSDLGSGKIRSTKGILRRIRN